MRWPGFRKVRKQVCKRIERRLRRLGLADVAAYRAYLEADPAEWSVLDSFCRISISRFYRDRGVFELLERQILPRVAEAAAVRGDHEVRCWSAGCASGEEVYTLKIIWKLCVLPRFSEMPLRIVATDADETMLRRARQGCYSMSSLKDFPRRWLDVAFDRAEDLYSLRAEFREGIDFQLQDIRKQQPDGPFHLIVCRHLVFTYYDEALQRELLGQMTRRLLAGGILVAGKQEPLPPGEFGLEAYRPRMGIFEKPHTGQGHLQGAAG
jgi:chemotaxis protein methyltransferase CheR